MALDDRSSRTRKPLDQKLEEGLKPWHYQTVHPQLLEKA